MGKIIGKAFFCGVAGLLAWLITAPMFPKTSGDSNWGAIELLFMLFLTSFVGATAGFFQGIQRGGRINILISLGMGLVFGSLLGLMGYAIGGNLLQALFRPGIFQGAGNFIEVMIARMMVITPVGGLLGLGIGASMRSVRGAISGLVGGLFAGMVAGLLFDPIGSIVGTAILAANPGGNEVGVVSRAITAVLLGFMVGLFTAIADHVSRQAWLRLTLARNEGREWPIDAAQTLIGRDERAHVPLFDDPQLPALAAVIERRGGVYVLKDPGTPIGVGLNGFRVQDGPLKHGDQIQVGALNLTFLMKPGAARRAHEGRAPFVPITQNAPVQPAPVPSVPVMAARAGPRISILSGAMAGQTMSISGPFEIGREGAGLRLSGDANASRRHAIITPSPNGLVLQDLGSTNGTLVNGVKVSTAVLRPGDIVTIGAATLRVEA